MSSYLQRDFATIQKQVHPLAEWEGKFPGAWWVGTDKTLPLRDANIDARKRDADAGARLAETVDADPEKNWVVRNHRGVRLLGFTPLDPTNPHKALRPDKDTAGMWVPNRRTKAGKDLAREVEEWNRHRVSSTLPGFGGDIMTVEKGQRYWNSPNFIIRPDMYPVVTLAADPDGPGINRGGFTGPLTIDPELWERVPLSWFVRITEGE